MSPDDEKDAATSLLLRVDGLCKAFPGVQALSSTSFELRAGEIHALVGENGAGKSTLIKVLTGVHQPDEGTLLIDGRERRFSSPIEALRAGITAIYQELSLVPNLSVAANLLLGREQSSVGLINTSHERSSARETLAKLGLTVDPDTPVADLSLSERQLVEIARSLLADARIIIMDEPTAALTPREVERLFVVLREISSSGIGVIFVSHRLDEVLSISDRITVMRDGGTIATRPTAGMSRKQLIEMMVGRPLEDEFPGGQADIGRPLLEVRDLEGARIHGVSFAVRAGEILGIAGLMGAGRSELARLIFGADRRLAGEVLVAGTPVDSSSPRAAIDSGIALLNEDRKGQGLVLCLSASDNFALPNWRHWSRWGLANLRQRKLAFGRHVESLAIKISGHEQRAEFLSGGNQQKLLVARWLETDSQVIIFDEPTRGIDVGAKYEMYVIIRKLASAGKAIVIISSDLPEILGMCDRILVMKSGRVSGEIGDASNATQDQVMALAI